MSDRGEMTPSEEVELLETTRGELRQVLARLRPGLKVHMSETMLLILLAEAMRRIDYLENRT